MTAFTTPSIRGGKESLRRHTVDELSISITVLLEYEDKIARQGKKVNAGPARFKKTTLVNQTKVVFWWARRDLNPHVRSEH